MNAKFVSTLALLAGFTGSIHAAAYVGSAYEGFGYPDGTTVATQTGGTGFNAAGDLSANTTTWGAAPAGGSSIGGTGFANVTNTLGGLNYAGLASSGGNAFLNGIPGSSSTGRFLGQDVDSGTLYFSFLMQKNNSSIRSLNFSLWSSATAGGTATERASIGQTASGAGTGNNSGGNFAITVANSPVGAENIMHTSASPIALGNTTHLVVGKLTLDSSLSDILDLYIDPTVGLAEPGSTYLTATIQMQFIRGFRMFAGGGSGVNTPVQMQLDEIRFGTTWDSVTPGVVPEPASLTLLLAGAVVMAGVRRKNNLGRK